jgi:hypothetical protein
LGKQSEDDAGCKEPKERCLASPGRASEESWLVPWCICLQQIQHTRPEQTKERRVPIHPEQAKLFEEPFIAILSKAKGEINQSKKQWKADQDYPTASRKIANVAADLLKYPSYLLGHAVGLNKPIEEVAPEAWRLLQSEEWFLPWIAKLDDTLVSMMNSFNDWKSLDVFEPLKQVMRGLLVDCGITMKFDGSKLRVWVREGKLPAY